MPLPNSLEELDDLKYADLQKIAKEVGIKANMKAALLKQALKDYHSTTENKENQTEAAVTKLQDEAILPQEETKMDAASPKEKKPKQKKTRKGKKGSKRIPKEDQDSEQSETDPECSPKSNKESPVSKETPKETEETRPLTPDLLVQGIKMTPVPTPVKNKTPATTDGGRKRKRTKTPETKQNTTFELETASVDLEKEATPGSKSKRTRRGTFEIEKSPGAEQIVNSLTDKMDADQMKATILGAIEKKVQDKKASMPAAPKTEPTSHIPRFAAFLASKKQESSMKKPITPGNKDWSKIHKRNFEKMESIDVYLAKKRKRTDEITASVKKAKLLAEQTKRAVETIKNHRTPTHKGAKIVRPVKSSLTFKTPGHVGVPFVPTVTSTTKMNINFAGTKTPSFTAGAKPVIGSAIKRKSPRLNEETKENVNKKKSMGVLNTTIPTTTPFKVNTTQSPPKKAVFDLKASLSKPLSWKPHTGKLEPWAKKANFKTHKPQTKEDRVKAAKLNRADKKFDKAMQRRGIVA